MNKTAQEMGRKGGQARARNLSKEKLSAIGKKGAKARWRNHVSRKEFQADIAKRLRRIGRILARGESK